MPSYAKAGGWQAVGQGLRGIGDLLVRNRQEEEAERRRQEAIDRQMGMRRDQEMLQPEALPLSQVANAAQELPDDAFMTQAGTMVSPSYGQEQRLAQQEAAWDAQVAYRLEADEALSRQRAERAKLASELEEYENFYGQDGQTRRAIGSFFVENVLKPAGLEQYGSTPEAAIQIGQLLAGGQQAGGDTIDAASQRDVMSWIMSDNLTPDPGTGEKVYTTSPKEAWRQAGQIVSGAPVERTTKNFPSMTSVTGEDPLDLSWLRGGVPSANAPLPNETALDFARRLKNQGMSMTGIAQVLSNFGMYREDATGS